MSEKGGGFDAWTGSILRRGRQRGFLTVSELMADLDEFDDESPEEEGRWITLINRLSDEGIRVVEEVEDVGGRRDRPGFSSGEAPGNPVTQYLREIGRYSLLTAEQEVELAVQIEGGVRAGERLEERGLSAGERRDLRRRVEQGERAYNSMVESNLRLVVSIARKTFGSLNGALLLDLIQEGNLGLMKAAQRFDHRRGFRFSTYAVWWIRQPMIKMFSEQSRPIRVPAYLAALIPPLNDARRELTQEHGRPPTTAELAARLEVGPEVVERMVRLSQRPISLQDPVGSEDDGVTVGDLVEDLNAKDPLDAATLAFLQRYLAHVLKNLRDREQEILRLRFGLEDGRVWTLGELSRQFRVTKERIRQMERKALSKIRHHRFTIGLDEFLD
ncbi:MAG: sigma-70 family RNA polymerase sigma factor [Acidimicrobiia bacterium]|nr:sigma-70 family RNA polymerase sigma factor [bacterium]MDE0674600.1 sigma-70 family RNA polymerase sigma factor [bacterium]MXX00910.1 sigma-70 family RNA polymerase sigma factor [Acidimicrobiia bacterium]